MSATYRDELEQAEERVADLEARIAAQDEEIRALCAQGAERGRGGRGRVAIAALALIAVAGGGAWVALRRAAPRPAASVAPPPEPAEDDEDDARPARAKKRPLSDPGFHLSMPDDAEVAALAGRCPRESSRTIDLLPAGTRVLDFTTCAGCDCCRPDGSFPDLPAREQRDERDACLSCARTAALHAIGFRMRGWPHDTDPIRAHGVVIDLERPARLVAIEVQGITASAAGSAPRQGVSLTAFDGEGRAIDAARAPLIAPSPEGPSRWPSLRVEACPGEVIRRLEIASDRVRTDLTQVAFLPAD